MSGNGSLRWSVAAALLAGWLSAGCRTAPRPAPASEAAGAATVTVYQVTGEVLHVNQAGGYVVIRSDSLLSPGEEATVFRGDEAIGRLRISDRGRVPFAAADVVEGEPRRGDAVRVTREEIAAATGEGRKE